MLELGDESEELHRELGEIVKRSAERLLTFGPEARAIAEHTSIEAESFEDIDELNRRLLELVGPGDLVLIKGSRGMRLERVAAALAQRFG
jgi:UDP-N-acetylmuramoyl-tripeptide--D-alanyl-D-alanine ligase